MSTAEVGGQFPLPETQVNAPESLLRTQYKPTVPAWKVPEKKPEDDGIIDIGRGCTKKFRFGNGPVVELDVVRLGDWWWEIDRSFRTNGDSTQPIAPDKIIDWSKARANFARVVVTETFKGNEQTINACLTGMDDAGCLKFLVQIEKSVEGLKGFFDAGSGSEPSPAPPSDSATVFTE